MKKILFIILIGIGVFASSLEGVVPRKWELRDKDAFLKGKLDGISVSSEGVLTLAPREDRVEGPAEDFYLCFLVAPDGTAFLGTGHGGKIYRLAKDGKVDLFFQAPEMDVTCLAQDSQGTVYAGTSPNGKIYKISGKDQSEIFFNPGEKYIWDLVFADNGFLLAAVGEGGGVYKISPKGEGQLILKAEENHILCLKRDEKGGFLAGSGGLGVLYRLSSEGRTSVLFESPFEEIKSLAVNKEGQIYVAAGGSPSRSKKEATTEAASQVSADVTVTVSASPQPSAAPVPSAAQREPGALFRVRSDGVAKKLWESEDEMIYALHWDEAEKNLIFGTGNNGRIYVLDKDDKTSLLFQEPSEQAYALIPSGQRVYVLANNPSRLSLIFPEQRFNGEYLSDVLDTKTVSSWGKLEFEAELQAGTTLQLQTRSGNSFEPNSLWSDWSPPYQKEEEQILSPKARYLQLKILFKTQSGKASPSFRRAELFYLQANLAPVITKLGLLPPNEVYLKPPEQDEVIWGASDTPLKHEGKKEEVKASLLAKKVERKGFQTIVWEAEDDNEDDLSYCIFIRKEGETVWRALKEGWSDSLFAFDTVSFPDGIYFIKVEASDIGSNPPGTELKVEKISQPLTIDNSLPAITNFTAVKEGTKIDVAFQAADSFSALEKAEYLIRPGEWRVVFPVDGICDSKQESFKFTVPLPAKADNLITVRVIDRHHNIGVFRQAF
jgi:sugar lactone lactonase YvrE